MSSACPMIGSKIHSTFFSSYFNWIRDSAIKRSENQIMMNWLASPLARHSKLYLSAAQRLMSIEDRPHGSLNRLKSSFCFVDFTAKFLMKIFSIYPLLWENLISFLFPFCVLVQIFKDDHNLCKLKFTVEEQNSLREIGENRRKSTSREPFKVQRRNFKI